MKMHPTVLLIAVAFLTLSMPVRGQTPNQSGAQNADELFQAEKWEEAAAAYDGLTKSDSANGRAWYRLGQSLHRAAKFSEAIQALTVALDKVQPGNRKFVMYALASAYARSNKKVEALAWLTKAIDAGFNQAGQLDTDNDLSGLRGDKEFKELVVRAEANAHPCLGKEQHHQLDFWIGEWNVENSPGQAGAGQAAGESRIERIVDGCILLENYSAGTFVGKSFNFYDSNLKRWRQTWVDNNGGVSEFNGEFKDGAIRLNGESHTPDGSRILRHMTLFNLGPDRVRQLSEASTDDGKTWRVNYDFTYVRKKP